LALTIGKLLESKDNNSTVSALKGATYLTMTGNPLELKLRLVRWKHLAIDMVMTSFNVITLKIGQSAGKIPKSVMIRTRYSLNDVENNAKRY
jgi:hypothetical protein